MGVNSLPKTVTRQRRRCDLNPDPSAPESSTLTTRLSSQCIENDDLGPTVIHCVSKIISDILASMPVHIAETDANWTELTDSLKF